MKQPFIWDSYSDQPYPLKDKKYKKSMRQKALLSFAKTFIIAFIILPISMIIKSFIPRKKIDLDQFFCIGIDYQREPETTIELVKELGAKHILVRFKMWEMETLDELKEFLSSFKNHIITLKILQDREQIEDAKLLHKNLMTIFSALHTMVSVFEIGSTINRAKWGFFSVDEYNHFYKVAYDIKTIYFPNMKLIGSGVIDFEYHFTAHTLFHTLKSHYNGVAALLYVDRRGAPENEQMGFNLMDKIEFLAAMTWLSSKTDNKLYLTETNWPISNTAPYAPTSEKECVDEESYADFLVRYYLVAWASQQVNMVSWHQLIAAGYGLIDNRDGLRKRSSFYAYKFLISIINGAIFTSFDIKSKYFKLNCHKEQQSITIYWSLAETTLPRDGNTVVFSRDGKEISTANLQISSSPIYVIAD